MTDELDGDALNRAIAEAMGWAQYKHAPGVWSRSRTRRFGQRMTVYTLPDFAHSDDALREPERVLRAAGWRQSHIEMTDYQEWYWHHPADGGKDAPADGTMDDPVRARACLAALLAMNAAKETR